MPLRRTKRRLTARRKGNRSKPNLDSFEQMESKYTQAQQDLKSCAEQVALHGLTSVKDLERFRQRLQDSEEVIHHRESYMKAALKQLKRTYPANFLEGLKKMDWSTTATPEPGENMTDEEESIYDPESEPEMAPAQATASARNRARSRTICALNEPVPGPIDADEIGSSAASTSANQRHQPPGLDRGTHRAVMRTGVQRAKPAQFPRNDPIQYRDVSNGGIPHSYILSHIEPGKFHVLICRSCNKYFGRQGKEVMRGAERHVRGEVHTEKQLTARQKGQFAVALPSSYFHAAWLLGYCVEDCTAKQAFESNVAFLSHHTNQGVEPIFKKVFEQFKDLLPSEQMSRQRVENIYRQCKGITWQTENEASSGDGNATAQVEPQSTNEEGHHSVSEPVVRPQTSTSQSPAAENDPFADYDKRFESIPPRRSNSTTQMLEETMASLARTSADREIMSTTRNAPDGGGMHQGPQMMSRPSPRHEQPPRDRLFTARTGNHGQSDARMDLHMSYNGASQSSEPSGLPADGSNFEMNEWDHQYQLPNRAAEAAM